MTAQENGRLTRFPPLFPAVGAQAVGDPPAGGDPLFRSAAQYLERVPPSSAGSAA